KKELTAQLTLPSFVKGEKGAHEPSFLEKETKPPRNFTEASLLRAMETAGKQVDDDEMRELMKENGIGRPSTRASIIETLFRRKYIERKKKLVLPTSTGIQLIELIDNELLKSAELTGRWEKRLKEIERGDFNAGTFIKNMKKMVDDLVYEVRSNKSKVRISQTDVTSSAVEKSSKKKTTKKEVAGKTCPKCNSGKLLKGSNAFGCSAYTTGCNFKIPFEFLGKKISENQVIRLLEKGSTTNLKGFKTTTGIGEGLVRLDESFELVFEEKKEKSQQSIHCPKCKKGTILKGNTAYGCSDYKLGCDFVVTFKNLKIAANGKKLTRELVLQLLNG
ncbi:MAG: DNA topoisomerase, partial [Polaribacter sp.]|nr:DNA topoisomerase [Polaribacter sp.]